MVTKERAEQQDQRTTHRSTQRVLDILSTLSEADDGLSMADICRALDAPKSSLFPILHTMAASDFITYDEATARYSLGLRSCILGSSYERKGGVLGVFKAAMREAVSACQETSQLGVLDHGRVLYIAKVDSAQPVQLRSSIGKTLGLTYTAIGKALVSELPEDEVRALVGEPLERPTDHALATMDEFLAELAEVRRTGFAYDREETTEGVQCIAVPVRQRGHIAYGISVTTPSYRLTDEKAELIRRELTFARERVERLIS
ncbi:IclR family transcriptional regulator C-terminal domain-containing protein [uncultured Parolsenella sp.]|uniref:IclR family transcriptional regulator n=1 Tax=uncultured Parolsenella sp. TaxID=2083008 RepID=UPI0027D96EE6|nr:IclR family transcriptional regulator C-terminal domain-containing protein [uncultured Parolsenella sp.]